MYPRSFRAVSVIKIGPFIIVAIHVLGIVSAIGAIFGALGSVVAFFNHVLTAFLRVIAASKLFCTILLIGVCVTVWYYASHRMDDILSLFVGVDSVSSSIDASFLSSFCTPSRILDLSYDMLSAAIVYYSVFASGIGFSLLVKLHAMASRSIRI